MRRAAWPGCGHPRRARRAGAQNGQAEPEQGGSSRDRVGSGLGSQSRVKGGVRGAAHSQRRELNVPGDSRDTVWR